MSLILLATMSCVVAQPGFGPPGPEFGPPGPSDVNIDWDKILDMSTDVTVTGAHIPIPTGPRGEERIFTNLKLNGHIQLDVFGEKLKVTVTRHVTGALVGDSSAEMVFDGTKGLVAVRGHGAGSAAAAGASAEVAYCVRATLPQRLRAQIPTPDMLKQMAVPLEQQVQMYAGMLPHTTAGGVVTYNDGEGGVVRIRPDGVPIELSQQGDAMQEIPDLDVKFSSWVQGAGDVEPFHCAAGSPTDLAAHPQALHPVALVQLLAKQLEGRPETQQLAAQLSGLSSVLAEELQRAAEEPSSWWKAVPVAAAGGAGGLLALALAKAFSRKTAYSEPLLSA